MALGDSDRLLQAASNLLENALRLTPPGGSVTVSVGPGQVSVRDTGPGLDSQDLPHAFERFYLHERYRSERPVGSGLGLAIVRELVAAMGGRVEARRPESGGAEFVMRLPYAGTLRSARCCPTLRLTRCSALSTVLQSQSEPAADLLVGVAVEVQREHSRLEL